MTRTRLGRTGLLLASMALALSACGDQTSTGGAASPGEADTPQDSSATASSDADDGGYQGLCSWVTPEAMEAIFGEPVDGLGGTECRLVPADETGSEGFYHVRLEQAVAFDDQVQRLEQNQSAMGFKICDTQVQRWQGLRISRRVVCPSGGDVEFQPQVDVELGAGRLLTNLPYTVGSKEEAEQASRRFVEIMKAFATTAKGMPLINEVMPGKWVELYNPGTEPYDLAGATLVGYDDFNDSSRGEQALSEGVIPPGGVFTVDITGLKGTTGDAPFVELLTADGTLADVADLNSVDPQEVRRRSPDGGIYCPTGLTSATRGKANPATCD